MKKTMMKVMAVALLVATVPSLTGCYGPFRLTSKLHAWNGEVSNKKGIQELVFLGLCILPAYEICTLGDALIFNSIEFWGGKNPIAMNDGEQEIQDVMHDGKMYEVIKTKNHMTVAAKESDDKAEFAYFPEEGKWYQMNGSEKGLQVR